MCFFALYAYPLSAVEEAETANAFAAYGDDFRWLDDWDEGMALARKLDKPVIVYFTSASCGSCRAMEKHTFASEEIRERFTSDWICIRMKSLVKKTATFRGKQMSYSRLRKYLRVNGVPSYIFFDREGEPVQSVVGTKDIEEFGDILDYMRDEAYKKGVTFQEYRNGGGEKKESVSVWRKLRNLVF